jgi:hypothetical protein
MQADCWATPHYYIGSLLVVTTANIAGDVTEFLICVLLAVAQRHYC